MPVAAPVAKLARGRALEKQLGITETRWVIAHRNTVYGAQRSAAEPGCCAGVDRSTATERRAWGHWLKKARVSASPACARISRSTLAARLRYERQRIPSLTCNDRFELGLAAVLLRCCWPDSPYLGPLSPLGKSVNEREASSASASNDLGRNGAKSRVRTLTVPSLLPSLAKAAYSAGRSLHLRDRCGRRGESPTRHLACHSSSTSSQRLRRHGS